MLVLTRVGVSLDSHEIQSFPFVVAGGVFGIGQLIQLFFITCVHLSNGIVNMSRTGTHPDVPLATRQPPQLNL